MLLAEKYQNELSDVSEQYNSLLNQNKKIEQQINKLKQEQNKISAQCSSVEFRKLQLEECASFSYGNYETCSMFEKFKTTKFMDEFLGSEYDFLVAIHAAVYTDKNNNLYDVNFILSKKLRTHSYENIPYISFTEFKKGFPRSIIQIKNPQTKIDEFVNKVYNQLSSENLNERSVIPLNESQYILAQSSSDRYGFYAEWESGYMISQKKYGEGPLYPIIALWVL